ncbi:MAG: Asp-tRNA(Asn)/Glu-tRNA(Gln) amidotransferase subunit GatC [Candidatus Omnitrophota bacterium]
MSIKEDKIRYLSRLARIKLSEEEAGLFSRQLDDILAYVEKLNELDVTGVLPMSHPHSAANFYRQDEITQSLPREAALKNAPQEKNGFFKVPKIIEDQGLEPIS